MPEFLTSAFANDSELSFGDAATRLIAALVMG